MKINHSKIKETNRKKVIKLLLENDEMTKLDISRTLDISITTVSTNINELKELGIVDDERALESTGGRKATAIKLLEDSRYSVGVAITPKNIKISLVNLKKKVVDNVYIRHNRENISNIITVINNNIEEILERNKVTVNKLLGIGISIPGIVDSENGIIKNCYFLRVKDFNIKESFKHFNVPVYIDNEANLSAYYEFLDKKHELDNLLYISITDGLGLGIVLNGEIYRGNKNAAGELGHMKIERNGKLCECGARGCLESYTSKNALIESYNEGVDTKIDSISEFEEKFTNDNEIAKVVFNNYLERLAIGISNLIMILDPNTIVIGGEINSLLEMNLNTLKIYLLKNNFLSNFDTSSINIANFKETYLVGAAMLPIEEFLKVK